MSRLLGCSRWDVVGDVKRGVVVERGGRRKEGRRVKKIWRE